MLRSQLYWLAGLLEGEGCFCYDCSPGIQIGMTDRDVIEKVGALLKKSINGPYKYPANRKPVFYVRIWGSTAVEVMKSVLPFMGQRRAAKIQEILLRWKQAPGKGHKRGTGRKTECHPDRKHYAFGLCRSCYRKDKWSKGLSR